MNQGDKFFTTPASVHKDTSTQSSPGDLAAAVGAILAPRVGLAWAIRRPDLLQLIRQKPEYKRVNDPAVRKAIETLREGGLQICNLMDDSGYFIARDNEEYLQFREIYAGKAFTMLRILKKMDDTARERWGALGLQEKLF